MELKELITIFKKNSRLINVSVLVFALAGWAFFSYYPTPYKATGSFYVSRVLEPTFRTDFSYEGYYAQQAGTNYTGTLIGLLESVDIRKETLESLEIPVNQTTLRNAARNIKAKKAAPQLVTLTIKALSAERAEEIWKILSEEVVGASNRLNAKAGDSLLTVLPVGEGPVVYEGFKDLHLSIAVGAAFGLFLGLFITASKEYLS